MPSIKFAKTDKEIPEIPKPYIEDKLIVKYDSENKGRIFYEWDEDTILEIGSLQLTYYSKAPMVPTSGNTINIAKSNIFNLPDYGNDPESAVASTNITINSLVYDGTNIGIIIGEDTNNVTIFVIYKPTPLQWNDYFA